MELRFEEKLEKNHYNIGNGNYKHWNHCVHKIKLSLCKMSAITKYQTF